MIRNTRRPLVFLSLALALFSLVIGGTPNRLPTGRVAEAAEPPCGRFGCGAVVARTGQTHTVEVRDFEFVPPEITIDVGDTVVWQRVEGLHNVVADDGRFRLGEPNGAPGTTWTTVSYTFDEPGAVSYHCEVHGGPGSGMVGTVIVRSDSSADQRIYLPLVTK